MTATRTTSPTIGGLLFEGTDPPDEIQRRLNDHKALKPVVASVRHIGSGLDRAAATEVASIVAGLLEMDLLDVLVGGWKKYDKLASAAEATLASPGEEQVIPLATHRITSTHAPSVTVFVDEARVGKLDFAIELEAVIHALCAVVSDGKLMAIRSGHIELGATLSCEGVELASSPKTKIDASLQLDLGDGVSLVEAAAP